MQNDMGFYLFAKNMGKNLGNSYGQKPLDRTKVYKTDEIKTASKREIQKTLEAACDPIGKKATDKITNVSKKSSKELRSTESHSNKLHSEDYT